MNIKIALLSLFPLLLLHGCASGPQATFSERMQDGFLFTSADNIPSTEKKCITLTKPFSLQSGSITYSIPAGIYIAKKKNKTGYFYYAPTKIISSNWLLSVNQQGIYLANDHRKGNLFYYPPNSYNRPIRSNVLPDAILSSIQINNRCE